MKATEAVHRLPGLFALVLGTAVAGYAATFPELEGGYPGPGLFPGLVGVGLAACGLVLLIRPGAPERTDEPVVDAGWIGRARFGAGLLLVLVFPWLRGSLGFFLASSLLALTVARLLGARWTATVLTSALASGAIYLFFTRLLGVPL